MGLIQSALANLFSLFSILKTQILFWIGHWHIVIFDFDSQENIFRGVLESGLWWHLWNSMIREKLGIMWEKIDQRMYPIYLWTWKCVHVHVCMCVNPIYILRLALTDVLGIIQCQGSDSVFLDSMHIFYLASVSTSRPQRIHCLWFGLQIKMKN